MTEKPKSRERALSDAIMWSSDFISSWDRFNSVLAMMEDSLRADVKRAENASGKMDSDLAEEFLLNAYWLRQLVQVDAHNARQLIEAAGYSCGVKV